MASSDHTVLNDGSEIEAYPKNSISLCADGILTIPAKDVQANLEAKKSAKKRTRKKTSERFTRRLKRQVFDIDEGAV